MTTKKGSRVPNTRLPLTRKPARLQANPALSLGQRCPSHCPPQPAPILGQQGPVAARAGRELGPPMDIRQTAKLIGCSPWTVRQKLLRLGLPHLRFGASGKITFYRDQVIRWIEKQQGGTAQP